MNNNLKIRNLSKKKIWDYENGFYLFSSVSRINKLLSHYELYKMILGLPGHIFELGVYKGASLIRFATFRNLVENDLSRKILGFDAYGEFPKKKLKIKKDLKFIKEFQGAGGFGFSEKEIRDVMDLKKFQNVELIKGNIFTTIPKYLKDNPEVRISFLHLDLDVKEPTEFALEQLYNKIVPGGLIVFDDYNAVSGETIAVDKFLKKKKLKIEKLPYYNVPSFLRKPIR